MPSEYKRIRGLPLIVKKARALVMYVANIDDDEVPGP